MSFYIQNIFKFKQKMFLCRLLQKTLQKILKIFIIEKVYQKDEMNNLKINLSQTDLDQLKTCFSPSNLLSWKMYYNNIPNDYALLEILSIFEKHWNGWEINFKDFVLSLDYLQKYGWYDFVSQDILEFDWDYVRIKDEKIPDLVQKIGVSCLPNLIKRSQEIIGNLLRLR